MTQRAERLAWAFAMSLTVMAAWVWLRSTPLPDSARVSGEVGVAPMHQTTRTPRDFISRNPFRMNRRPSSVRFGEVARLAVLPPVIPQGPRPALMLRGIVGGPPWEALLEGLPGRNGGVLVRSGDRFGLLVIGEIGRNLVMVSAPDTTWRLTMANTWR